VLQIAYFVDAIGRQRLHRSRRSGWRLLKIDRNASVFAIAGIAQAADAAGVAFTVVD